MAENLKADIYLAYLDQVLAGEKNIDPVEDVEIKKLLLLAKTMIAADLSVNSKIRENLRKQLLIHLNNESGSSAVLGDDNELDEEALDHVAAAGDKQPAICPYCGSTVPNLGGKCPYCNH